MTGMAAMDDAPRRQDDLPAQLARFFSRLTGTGDTRVATAVWLAAAATADGNICVDLRAHAGRGLPAGIAPPVTPTAPELDEWLAALRGSPIVGSPGEYRPLILDADGRLYLHRYWQYQQRLADDLHLRASADVSDVDTVRLQAGLARLFPQADGGDTDWQRLAAAVAVLRRLCILSGGPGTGKTTTVVRVLALLIEQAAGAALRVGLAAPTGKAAARMQEAIRTAKQALPADPVVLARIPDDVQTLHRLLGGRPDSVRFRHDRSHPLPLDVLVVDEASMVDLALMAKLVDALPAPARLILAGDKDQLASVEPGSVLGDLCAATNAYTPAFAQRLRAVTGAAVPLVSEPRSPLHDSIVLLTRSYRFEAAGGIGRLAQAVQEGDAVTVMALLGGNLHHDVRWQTDIAAGGGSDLPAIIQREYRAYLDAVATGAPVAEVFAAFGRYRVLCAHRRGLRGAAALNAIIEERLLRQGMVHAQQGWYAGRPIIISRNHYRMRLFNGDLGIALRDAATGELRVHFQTPEGGARHYSPSRLPEHDTAYALTVHKAQGSEFDSVLLVLPDAPSPILSRELFYTGVTRARRQVRIHGPLPVIEAAIRRQAQRASGLSDALWS